MEEAKVRVNRDRHQIRENVKKMQDPFMEGILTQGQL
jgi:hypothetical protein